MLTSLGLWILSGREGANPSSSGEKAPAPAAAETAAPAAAKPEDKTATTPPATHDRTEGRAEDQKPRSRPPRPRPRRNRPFDAEVVELADTLA